MRNRYQIKQIIADIDGTIISTKEIHFHSFNRAVSTIDPKYAISPEDHLKYYDGLSSVQKLQSLHEKLGFPLEKISEINQLKQQYTLELYQDIQPDLLIQETIKRLKQDGLLFMVASNAVRETVEIALEKLGILDLIDRVYTNQDVKNKKPAPDIFLRAMLDAGISPQEAVICEDSKHGLEAAIRSGGKVCYIKDPSHFTYERINHAIHSLPKNIPLKWPGKGNTTVLIPAAGLGKRFSEAGYKLPKPLIDVLGKPMIQRVVEQLNIDADYVYVIQREHYQQYNLEYILNQITPGCKIVLADGLIGGAAPHALLAKEWINNDKHLIIANSDQWIVWDSIEFMYYLNYHNSDGGILTFSDPSLNTKWSYARIDDAGVVVEVAEKKVISNHPTVGIYAYNKGSEFIKYAEQMIAKGIKTNNEFYICPVFNEMITDGKKIRIKDCQTMMGLGVPEDLEHFLKTHKELE